MQFNQNNSRFSDYLIKNNHLDEEGFKEWIFVSGMLFNSREIWWKEDGTRPYPHEGIDFHMFRDLSGKTHTLKTDVKISLLFDGKVVHIINDFIGKSIFVIHNNIKDGNNHILHSIYAHTKPESDIEVGKTLKEGEIVATIAGTDIKKTNVPHHLHLSTAWISDKIQYDTLNWNTINSGEFVTFCDPLMFIDCNYCF